MTQLVRYFLWLGTTGFGGPIALVGFMQRDLVEKRRWFSAGEWLAYTVDVKHAGLYTFSARVGSALPGRTFHVEAAGTVSAPISVPPRSRAATRRAAPPACRC